MLRGPLRLRTANLENEILQDLRALRGVMHLRVKLHRIPLFRDVLNARDGVVRLRHQLEARRQFERFVAMRHPDGESLGETLEQNRIRDDIDFGGAVLALVGRAHLSAERVHHELQAVTDAEDRQTEIEQVPIGGWGVFVVDGPRSTRQDNADGIVALDLRELCRARQYDRKNILLADAARDELRILRAK